MTRSSPDHGVVLLEVIKLTAQRAQAAQRAIGDRSGRDRLVVPPEEPHGAGETVRLGHADSIYVGAEELGLPSPSVTNTNLHHYLVAATATQPNFHGDAPSGWRSRIRRLLGLARQDDFNAAALHALHQLDHRTRVQQHVIIQLEAQLADTRRSVECARLAERP